MNNPLDLFNINRTNNDNYNNYRASFKIQHISYKFVLTLLLLFTITPHIFSTSELSMSISSQEPDPLRPGNYADLSIMLTNSGDRAVQEAVIEIEENEFLTLAANEKKTNTITVPAFSSSQDGFVILKKRVYVSEDAPIGELQFDVKAKTQTADFTKTLSLVIRDSKPSLEIITTQNEKNLTYSPGELKPYTLRLQNNQDISLQNVKISMLFGSDDDSSEQSSTQLSNTQSSSPFYISPGVNSKRISQISSNENVEVTFNLGVSPSAQIQPYKLPVLLEYEDVLGNTYEEEFELYIIVNTPVELLVNLDRVTNNQATFSIANPGPGVVRGAYVDFKDESGEVFSTQYLGNLNADDFQTIQSEVQMSNSSQDITLDVYYSDGFYNQYSTTHTFTIDEMTQESNSSLPLVIIGVVIIVAYISYRYYMKKKKSRDED
ncbi:MAG: COG1361 S-layer family protein [Candidatus Nanoarchaeia archaeon]